MLITNYKIRDITRKIILYQLIFSFFHYFGCYSSRVVDRKIFFSEGKTDLNSDFNVITYDNENFEIFWKTCEVVDDTLYAKGLKQNVNTYFSQPTNITLALVDIKYVEIDEYDELATAGCFIGSIGLLVLIIGAIASASSVDKTPKRCEDSK